MRAIAVAALLALGAAACAEADDDRTADVELPADADAVVVRWSTPVGNGVQPGGTSRLVITAGGDVYQAPLDAPKGWRIAAPPQPAAGDYVHQRIEADGIRRVLARAAELGLLAPPPAYPDVGVTDSASTEVDLTTADGEFVHVAYALGRPDDESDADRRDLARFVAELADLEQLSGDTLGPASPYVPTTWSAWVEQADADDGVPWPSAVDLAAAECVAVSAAAVAALTDRTTTVEVEQDGRGYLVRLVPVLPADDPCRP
jgi:hypothetical protein